MDNRAVVRDFVMSRRARISPQQAGVPEDVHHDVVGDLELPCESVGMISDPGLTLTRYVAEPAPPTARALRLPASWTAEHESDVSEPDISRRLT